MNVKAGKTIIPVRAPVEVEAWARKLAEYNGSTLSAVFVSAVRERMEREREAQVAKERALASTVR